MTEEKKITKNKEWFKYFYYGIIGIVVFLLIFLPIIVFVLKFHSYSISDKLNDWSDFGSYIGGIYTFFSVVILSILTVIAIKINRKISNTLIKKDIYQVYFHQLNTIYFNVITDYGSYETYKNAENAEKLNTTLYIFTKTLENLKDEAKMLNIDELSNKVDEIIKNINNFSNTYRTRGKNDRKEYFNAIISSKKELIKHINEKLKT